MSYGKEQEREIATIKERNIKIKLSDADIKRLWKKAGSVGMTASELLENFIGDLVDGTYTNGSDECILANEWFSRCGFGMLNGNSFLRYLINMDDLKDAVGLWDDINTIKKDLEYSESHKDEFTEEEIKNLKEDLSSLEEELNDIFTKYKDVAKIKAGTLEVEMENVLKWYKEMKQML